MGFGVNMKVCILSSNHHHSADPRPVDYILFITANVTVNPNLNEIRDYKYVDKQELIAMFDDPKNSFTPWFKLIARDFLFGWWDELLQRKDKNGIVEAKSLAGYVDGSKVVKMV
jgi:isopentenyl-diphosphate Delta-isomerase